MIRLLIDMNLSPKWTDFLNDAGYEADHWSMVGDPSANDIDIMAFAARHQRIVLTHDLDFGAILAASGDKGPSVIQIRASNLSPLSIGADVIAALRQEEDALIAGALLTLEVSRARIALLPLRR